MDATEKAKPVKEEKLMNRLKSKTDIDSYAECYPGLVSNCVLVVCYVKFDLVQGTISHTCNGTYHICAVLFTAVVHVLCRFEHVFSVFGLPTQSCIEGNLKRSMPCAYSFR